MKAQLFTMFVLLVSLTLTAAPLHQAGARPALLPATAALSSPGPTLHLNLGAEPPTIDPALATDTTSVQVAGLLFLGLTDYDDATMETIPELATSWNVSLDGRVWTFNMRHDAYWTDGHPVRAQDVEYGVKRTLAPATASDYAYVLYIIQGAEAYNTSPVTNPLPADTVLVKAAGDYTVVFTLTQAAGYFPGIAGMWVARPQPQWAIAAHGSNWTEPANIVTNGPYRLTEWTHDVRMTLERNATYYDAANVQIGTVDFAMIVEASTAMAMYENGELDVTSPPIEDLARIRADPILSQQLTIAPVLCTYYYGFNNTKAPFNNTLVRKAFVAATNRQGLVNMLGGEQRPAQTFACPGVFGFVDGVAEGVGIPYNPAQAQQWLADAGYPGGVGLPPITQVYNTSEGHRRIAEYIRQNWIDNLGVTVTLQNLEWRTYLNLINTDPPQVFRLGWCADYPDQNNWVLEVFHSTKSANQIRWHNATFDSLVEQAAASSDPATRKNLYKQAETILCQTEAAMMPLYYYTRATLTKPDIQRTFAPLGGEHINKWRIQVRQVIPPSGGTVSSPRTGTTLGFPSGTFTATVVVTYTQASPYPPGTPVVSEAASAAAGTAYVGIGHCFSVTAVYSGTGQPAAIALGHTYTMTVQYTDAEKGPAIESTLALYWWNGSQWVKEPTCVVNPAANTVTATPNHLSLWTVWGETYRLYLPLVMKNY
jgi:oligopeptide transport system substrate-binding protein